VSAFALVECAPRADRNWSFGDEGSVVLDHWEVKLGELTETCFPCPTTRSAAPRFVVFEAWTSLLPASGDFSDPQLRLLRFIHHDWTGLVVSMMGGS